MKMQNKLNAVILSLFFVLNCNNEVTQKFNSQEEKETLIKRIEEFNAAFIDGNVDKLESMITDNYLHTNSSSKVIRKDDWLAYLVKRKNEIESGKLIVKDYKMDETEIEIYDNMAIVTGKISFSTSKLDEQKEHEIRITNIWIKDKDIWKRAGFHDTRIK
ncbi:nuclear transport factor 2 family protein [Aestuariivivens sediminis]|uniref:nuclear transport factor 2 family protein n=1 Tax=Aestuariivivens sediminis TaxID=2913557 RepID=UPI001F59EB5C|nr:nuclear transport factor 2 family protein [Aestuariivivens sediminis]